MVHLSELDSRKYHAILGFKKYLTLHPELYYIESSERYKPEIDEFGELAVKQVKCIQKRLSPDEIVVLIADYREGKGPVELGKKFGIHRSTVTSILKRNGIPIRDSRGRKI